MLKLKRQYFGYPMQSTDSLEKTLMVGKIESRRRRDDSGWDDWKASLTQWREFEQAPGDGEGERSLACCSPWCHKSQTQLSVWTELNWRTIFIELNKIFASWKKSYDKPRQHIKKQRHYFANKSLYSQSYGFSSSHVRMCELEQKEGWAQKNWYFLSMLLEKTLESSLDFKGIKSVNLKGNKC